MAAWRGQPARVCSWSVFLPGIERLPKPRNEPDTTNPLHQKCPQRRCGSRGVARIPAMHWCSQQSKQANHCRTKPHRFCSPDIFPPVWFTLVRTLSFWSRSNISKTQWVSSLSLWPIAPTFTKRIVAPCAPYKICVRLAHRDCWLQWLAFDERGTGTESKQRSALDLVADWLVAGWRKCGGDPFQALQ